METTTPRRPLWKALVIAIVLCAIAYAVTFWLMRPPSPIPEGGPRTPAAPPAAGP